MTGQTTTLETYEKPSIDIYEKGRLFLIGNGPSLRDTNLDLLIGEESWAMNRIHLIYDKTDWRPTRWFWADMPQRDYHRVDIGWHINSNLYPCYVRHDVLKQAAGLWPGFDKYADTEDCVPWVHCKHHSAVVWGGDKVPNEWHLTHDLQGFESEMPNPYPYLICKFGSGFSALIQMAVLEGYAPIILVGVDGNLKPTVDGVDYSHFDTAYWTDYMVTQEEADRTNLGLWHSHQMAHDYAAENGITILNATPDSQFTMWESVEYDALFHSR